MTVSDTSGNSVTAPELQGIGVTVSGEDGETAYMTVNATGSEHTNDSGGDLTYGQVVVRQADGSVTTTTTAQDTRPAGVVQVGNSDGLPVLVVWQGYVAQMNSVGSVTAGNYGETSSTAGAATENATPRAGSFATWEGTGTNPPAQLLGQTYLTTGVGGTGLDFFNVEDYGAVHDGSTDDTASIQAAINACFTAGGGVVYFPNGVYVLSSALSNTSTFNSQLYIPQRTEASNHSIIAIELRGNLNTDGQFFDPLTDSAAPTSGAILKSTISPAISGTPAIISCGKAGSPWFGGTDQSLVDFRVTGLTFRGIDNPKLAAIQAQCAWAFQVRHVTVDTNIDQNHAAQPTNSNAVGIMGTTLNGAQTLIDDVWVLNYYTGVRLNENATVPGDLWIENCNIGLNFDGPAYHASHVRRMSIVHCPYGVSFTGGVAQVWIGQLDIEHAASGWQVALYDVYDPSNYARGFVGWHTVAGGVGIDDALRVSGGTGLSFLDFVRSKWTLVDHGPHSNLPGHTHVTGETHLSDGSTTTYTLDNYYERESVIAWNTTTLARLTVTEVLPDKATVSAAGSSGDKIVFDYAATTT